MPVFHVEVPCTETHRYEVEAESKEELERLISSGEFTERRMQYQAEPLDNPDTDPETDWSQAVIVHEVK